MMSSIEVLTTEQVQEQLLRSAILRGLNAVPKTLPSILLWDDAGHELFKQITKSRCYYGPQADREIMHERIDEICRSLGDDGVLIELGAGSIPHTSMILGELNRRKTKTQYIAHDLVQSRLDQGLGRLASELCSSDGKSVHKMRGIVGTYEQFFEWLSKTHELNGRRVVVLWLGNCLSHYSDREFPEIISELMQSLTLSRAASSTLMLAVNGCKEADTMIQSYDSPDGTSVAFVANALRHANRILGVQAFQYDSWTPISSVDGARTSVNWRFRASKRNQLLINERLAMCKVGEDIDLITIKERDEADVAKLVEQSQAELVDIWRHPSLAWNWFVMINDGDLDGRTETMAGALARGSESGACQLERREP